MIGRLTLLSLFVVALSVTTFAQSASTPAEGSAERKAITNALRPSVEKDLRQKTVFKISTLNVAGSFAFIMATPQQADGSPIDYSKTRYQEAIDNGAFDDGITALLKKTGGKWRVVTYNIGATDVVWLDWSKKYKAPKTVFPGEVE